MLTIEKIDTPIKKQVKRFVNLPYRLYANHPQWVPPLKLDASLYLNRKKHFFYEHSEADFFLAVRDGRDVGRIAVLDHRRFNDYHGTSQAQFYLFECEDDAEAAATLFEQAFAWAKKRGLNKIIGPKGFGTLDPFGILIEGFEYRQMMTMSNYNYPYYRSLVETAGFVKEMDFSSYYLDARAHQLPEWVHNVANQVRQKADLKIQNFRTIREVLPYARQMIEIYNRGMVENWEYYPLSEREITAMVNDLKVAHNPRFLKIITHQQNMVGCLLVLPDLSAPLQQANGYLTPLSIINFLKTKYRPRSILLAWFSIFPQFRLQGGDTLIFTELEKDFLATPTLKHLELHQIADSVAQVWQDLKIFGLKPYKIHRVYGKHLA
jgi:hypothetical protein